MIDDLIWRAIKRAKIPTRKEPTGLIMQNGKLPDGATLIAWSKGKALAWDVTIADTYTASHLQSTALEAGRAAIHAAEMNCTKYRELDAIHIFVPIAIAWARWYPQLFWLQLQPRSSSKKPSSQHQSPEPTSRQYPTSKPREAVWPTQPNPLTCPSTFNELGTLQSPTAAYNVLMFTSHSPVNLASFKAVVTPHAVVWLHAPPLTAVIFRLSDEAIPVAIGFGLETNICQPHT